MIYQIQVGTDSSFASLWIDMDSVGTASVEVNGLSLGTRYFWRVRGVNSGGVGPFSESWSFRTIFTTGIEVIGEGVPRVLALHQNFPNPFNPATKIRFSVPKDGPVAVRVYDLLGREIATLINEEVMAGRLYQATFDARSISTGLYFYRIEFDGNALVRKMSLVK